jgi:hypothetical protein
MVPMVGLNSRSSEVTSGKATPTQDVVVIGIP